MDDKEKAPEEQFEIIEQGGTGPAANSPEPKVEDERLRSDDDDDEEDDNSSGSSEETPEQRAERRREERRKRRERQKRAEAENKAELQRSREQIEFMASKMQQMEALHLRNEARAIDQRMAQAKDAYERAERLHAEAVARGDGYTASQALRIRDQAAVDYRSAGDVRNKLMYVGQEPARPYQPQGPDPLIVSKAKAFVEKHSWIDPMGLKDEDSAVARALDMKLQADGYDPRTEEYWDKLESTLAKKLPHRFQNGGRSGPPTLGGIDRAGSGKKTFYLSPERKKAMMDSGDWDDPVRRNKMIKRYADYDAQQKSATR